MINNKVAPLGVKIVGGMMFFVAIIFIIRAIAKVFFYFDAVSDMCVIRIPFDMFCIGKNSHSLIPIVANSLLGIYLFIMSIGFYKLKIWGKKLMITTLIILVIFYFFSLLRPADFFGWSILMPNPDAIPPFFLFTILLIYTAISKKVREAFI